MQARQPGLQMPGAESPPRQQAFTSGNQQQQQQQQHPCVAPPPTPVQRREWQRAAQRTVRLALTGTRSAWSSFQAASDRGHTALAALSDTLLLMVQLPSMPLGALKDMPGIRQEAGKKLARQHSSLWLQLSDACRDMEQAAQDATSQSLEVQGLCQVVDSAQNMQQQQQQQQQVSEGETMEQVAHPSPQGQQHQQAKADASQQQQQQHSSWQASSPVFASIPAPRCAELLSEVSDMLQQEAGLRRSICSALEPADAALAAGRHAGHAASAAAAALAAVGAMAALPGVPAGSRGGEEQQKQLRGMLTVYLSSWLSAPYLDEDRQQEVVEALAEDMAGF